MAWTKAQQAEANAKGWGVFDVATPKGMRFMVLPLQFNMQAPNATRMADLLVSWAQTDKLARAALNHITTNGK